MGRIRKYDRTYRKRLILISPIVILAHLALLVAFEHVNIFETLKQIGYLGTPKPTPEITIIDSRATEDKTSMRERRPMIVQDVIIEGEDGPERSRGREPNRKKAKIKREHEISLEAPGDYDFRSYSSHAPVPYREDYIILRMVKPEYPPEALANLEEGYVLVEAYIGANGTVKETYVRSAYGPRSFEGATLDAVRQFLFRPVVANGKPMSFWTSFLVRFQIRR